MAESAVKRKTDPEKDLKHAAYAALIEKGMSKTAAAKVLGYSPGSIGQLDGAIERKGQKISIVSDRRVRAAHRTVDRLMAGKTWGKIEKVRAADAMAAAGEVLDRAEPKRQEAGGDTYNFTIVNLDAYVPGAPREIDVTPQPEGAHEPV